eukprot:709081-Alexandrium_andersonii.AAC.1
MRHGAHGLQWYHMHLRTHVAPKAVVALEVPELPPPPPPLERADGLGTRRLRRSCPCRQADC